jgi:formylglycine-generating enzyme required for sulfatase activity
MKLLFDENLATTDIHRGLGMKALLGIIIAILCLTVLAPAHAAKPKQVQKERLVLMPLRIPEEDKSLQGAMETALVEGLQQKYIVFSGEQVAQKAREIFLKESRNTAKKECDETRCMQGIAEAFQAELIATANVTKQDGGYFLALSVQNIFDNKVEYSKSTPCKGCDSFQVVDKLKELSGASPPASPPTAADNTEAPIVSGNVNDPETALWNEVKTTNLIDDYQTYLTQYPKGKYVALAKSRLNKLKEQEAAESAQQEQSAWGNAGSDATEDSYQDYLDTYPKGRYVALATARIAKLKKEAATASKAGKAFIEPEVVEIPAGSFDMGYDKGLGGLAIPVHRVNFAKPFAIGKTEVTQGQWKAIMGNNPSGFKKCGNNCPVENVSWNDAKKFIQKLNQKTGKQYRLPSEAEWEYACRAGGRQEYCGSDDADSVAWSGENSSDTAHPVATKKANAFGLYDMSGNVIEWVEDSYHNNYNDAPMDGSAWQGDGVQRVSRGGSWSSSDYIRPVYHHRFHFPPDARGANVGFRLARTLP